MLIRPADLADAEEAASVLRRSILELCILDHAGDARILEQWLRNKTPETVRSWIEARDRCVLVAEEAGYILGVGSASNKGEILLNYVVPEARFRRVSKSIIQALEAYVRGLGHSQTTLTSTRTAYAFYVAMGYEDEGGLRGSTTADSRPMRKSL